MKKFVTNVDGLDEMLYGGFCLPKKRGYTLLITGNSGAGKTILASQIAANYAVKKTDRSAVFFDTSRYSTPEELVYKLKEFDFIKNIALLNCEDARNIQNKRKIADEYEHKGIIFVASLSAGGIREFQFSLRSQSEAFKGSRLRKPYLYVIDELDFLGNSVLRDQWMMTCGIIQNDPKNFGILIKEKHDGGIDHVVDAIIEIGVAYEGMKTKRYIEILKAVGQKHYMGKKLFDINETGIVVDNKQD